MKGRADSEIEQRGRDVLRERPHPEKLPICQKGKVWGIFCSQNATKTGKLWQMWFSGARLHPRWAVELESVSHMVRV